MCKIENNESILKKVNKLILSKSFMKSNRLKKMDFTRNRKMPFSRLVHFMLNSVKQTLQKELTFFMNMFTKHDNITKSAFSQHRLKLKPEAFIELNDFLINERYKNKVKKWNGRRLLCIDGSTLELPKSSEIIENFGVNNESNMIPMAKISTLFDLLNEFILDSNIANNSSSEYNLAIEHLYKIKKDDLLILDRGYGARWLFFMLNKKGADFVIRLQNGFGKDVDNFWNSKENSKIIEVNEMPLKTEKRFNSLSLTFEPFKFRIVKVILKNGTVEVLATSLLDEKKYPVEIFKELYNKRWGIETNYSHLKNHIEIGNFTGYSTCVVKQDFYANTLIANIQRMIIEDAQEKLNDKTKNRKYEYKINKNLSLGFMKNKVIEILSDKNTNQYDELVKLFQIESIPIRNDREYPREKSRWKRKYYLNQKRSL